MGTITKENRSKNANLFFMQMPGSDSSDAISIDLFGVNAEINISGTFCVGDSGYATLELFIAALEALVNGNQSGKSFVSGKSGATYRVLVDTVDWESEEGAVTAVKYNIAMKESDV
jgi:hypothetical protein